MHSNRKLKPDKKSCRVNQCGASVVGVPFIITDKNLILIADFILPHDFNGQVGHDPSRRP